MSSKTWIQPKKLIGMGKVLKDEVPIAEVEYNITIHQRYGSVRTPRGEVSKLGRVEVKDAFLIVTSGEKDFANEENLTLLLEDGRKVRFSLDYINEDVGIYNIKLMDPRKLGENQ